MKKYLLLAGTILLFAVAAHFGCGFANPRERVEVLPLADTLFSSTRSVTSLLVAPDGSLWATTPGGVLRHAPDSSAAKGVWTKFSRRDGLPSHEARKVSLNEDGEIEILLPRNTATWRDEKWDIEKTGAPPNAPQAIDTEWEEQVIQAAPGVFRIRPKNSMEWNNIALPVDSRGSHVSALLIQNGVLWCALYGDSLWSYDGEKWQKLDIALPEHAREITALAFEQKNKTLWVGTRRDGIWQYSAAGWRNHLQPDEPLDHNAQYLTMFDGRLYMSTLDDGLQVRATDGWQVLSASTLSSDAPRHLVEYQDNLYVRHGNGKVDAFDKKNWSCDVFSKELPRKKCFALASDNEKLYFAQWGGWSEWDGKSWSHYLQIPELQGLPLMCLLPVDEKLWIGTQSRGVAEYSYDTGKLKWHDERHGLPDDWITCLAKNGKTLFAGTFVGGLAFYDGKHWKTTKELDGDNVTDIQSDGQGGVLVATRRGVWQRNKDGVLTLVHNVRAWLDREMQAVCVTKEGIWLGARTGLFWLRDSGPQTEPQT